MNNFIKKIQITISTGIMNSWWAGQSYASQRKPSVSLVNTLLGHSWRRWLELTVMPWTTNRFYPKKTVIYYQIAILTLMIGRNHWEGISPGFLSYQIFVQDPPNVHLCSYIKKVDICQFNSLVEINYLWVE